MVAMTGLPHVVIAATSSPFLWYVTRMFAISSYVTLTIAVVLGLIRTAGRKAGDPTSWIVDEMHTFLTTLTLALIGGHLITLLMDPFISFSVANLLLPMNEPYKGTAVSLGVFAVYTMGAIYLTSWARKSLSYGFWRATHYLSFVAFILVTAHGFLSGSDSGEPFMRAIYVASAGAVAVMTVIRMAIEPPRQTATTR